jgi:hypothetical protein
MIDIEQLTNELNESFSTVSHLHALSVVISYQHFAMGIGLEMSWAADKLVEHAVMIERDLAKLQKPQFAQVFTQLLRAYAEQIRGTEGPPSLTLIQGDKD